MVAAACAFWAIVSLGAFSGAAVPALATEASVEADDVSSARHTGELERRDNLHIFEDYEEITARNASDSRNSSKNGSTAEEANSSGQIRHDENQTENVTSTEDVGAVYDDTDKNGNHSSEGCDRRCEGHWPRPQICTQLGSSYPKGTKGNQDRCCPQWRIMENFTERDAFLRKLLAMEAAAETADRALGGPLMRADETLARCDLLGAPWLNIKRHHRPSQSRIKKGQFIGSAEFVDIGSQGHPCWHDGYSWHYVGRYEVIPTATFVEYVNRFSVEAFRRALVTIQECSKDIPSSSTTTTIVANATEDGENATSTNHTHEPLVSVCQAPVGILHASEKACAEGLRIVSGSICTPRCDEGYVVPDEEGPLRCQNGKFAPEAFTCQHEVVDSTGEVEVDTSNQEVNASVPDNSTNSEVAAIPANATIQAAIQECDYKCEGHWPRPEVCIPLADSYPTIERAKRDFCCPQWRISFNWTERDVFLRKLLAIEAAAEKADRALRGPSRESALAACGIIGAAWVNIERKRGLSLSRIKKGQFVGNAQFVDVGSQGNPCWPDGYSWHYIDKFHVIPSDSFQEYVHRFNIDAFGRAVGTMKICAADANRTADSASEADNSSHDNVTLDLPHAPRGPECPIPIGIAHALNKPCANARLALGNSFLASGESCDPQCIDGYVSLGVSLECHNGTLVPDGFACEHVDLPEKNNHSNDTLTNSSTNGSSGNDSRSQEENATASQFENSTLNHASRLNTSDVLASDLGADIDTNSAEYDADSIDGDSYNDFSPLLNCSGPSSTPYILEPPCAEGMSVASSRNCTPQCLRGYSPSETSLYCFNGTMFPAKFACQKIDTSSDIGISVGAVAPHSRTHPDRRSNTTTTSTQLMTLETTEPTSTTTLPGCRGPARSKHMSERPCAEGVLLASGDNCTTQCSDGYVVTESYLYCYNGTLSPYTFDCQLPAMPPISSLAPTTMMTTAATTTMPRIENEQSAGILADSGGNSSIGGNSSSAGNSTDLASGTSVSWLPTAGIVVISCVCIICLVKLCLPKSRRRVATNGSGPDYVSVDVSPQGEAQPYAACVCCGFLVCKVDRDRSE